MLGTAAGTTARQYARYLPDTQRRRGRDRRRAAGHRPPLLRPRGPPAAAQDRRGRAAVPAPLRGRLRRDHGRRLPPALHPLLPDHQGVLRARPRAAGARRRGGDQRRPPGGLGPARAGAERDAALGVRRRRARPAQRHQHDPHGLRRAADRRAAAGRVALPARGPAARSRCARPRACARASAAGASTPTTTRRSSGSWTSRSSSTRRASRDELRRRRRREPGAWPRRTSTALGGEGGAHQRHSATRSPARSDVGSYAPSTSHEPGSRRRRVTFVRPARNRSPGSRGARRPRSRRGRNPHSHPAPLTFVVR